MRDSKRTSSSTNPFHFVIMIFVLALLLAYIINDSSFQEILHRNQDNVAISESTSGAIGSDQPTFSASTAFADTIYRAFSPRSVRNLTVLQIAPEHGGEFGIEVICDVFDYFRPWKYVNDPIYDDYIADCEFSFRNRSGDCDDRATALAAALTAVGGETRIVLEKFRGNIWHAFPEVLLRDKAALEHAHLYVRNRYNLSPGFMLQFAQDKNGHYWLNLDWFADYPGGDYPGTGTGFYVYPVQKRCIPFNHNK